MTQPEEAVGGSNDDPVVAAEPTLEDRFAAIDEEEAPEGQPEAEEGEAPAEPELTEEDVADEEAETSEEEAPPIDPPVSWTAEEKEEFKNLPRNLQETLTRRESEREKFVQSKAQEAAQTRTQVEREALQVVQQVQSQAAAELQKYASMLEVPEPDPRLIAEDPDLYAQQLQSHRYYTAQREQAQQMAAQAQAQAQQAEAEANALEQEEIRSVLEKEFPEYLDPEKGPELRKKLGSTALALGYSADQLANVDAKDILAMKIATEKFEKADKYDKLMARKMEGVRAGKLPRVSKPGVAQGAGAQASQRYAADRQAMKAGDKDATVRTFSRFL